MGMNASQLDLIDSLLGDNPSPEAIYWIQSGFTRWLNDESASLADALEINTRKSVRKAYRVHRRNALLIEAAGLLDPDRTRRPYSLAKELIDRMERVACVRAPRASVDRLLRQALDIDSTGLGLNNIRQIIADARG